MESQKGNNESQKLDVRMKRVRIRLPLITERIVIDEFGIDDQKTIQEIYSQEDISNYIGSPYCQKGNDSWLEAFERTRKEDREAYSIRERTTKQAIGFVSLFPDDEDITSVEISIGLALGMRNRGYALEASKMAIQAVFAYTSAVRVVARVDPRNTSSLRLVENLGMTSICTRRNELRGSDEQVYAKAKPASN